MSAEGAAKPPLSIDRRALVRGLAGAAIPAALSLPASAKAVSSPARPEDEHFMREAIDLAANADFPFGAVIVRDGKVVGRGMNLGGRLKDPTAHGEMIAIRRVLAHEGPAALKGATLYTSGEPCAMCMGAIAWCGITRLVFAASLAQLATVIDQIMIPSAEVAEKSGFATIAITGGVLADDAMKLFKR
ncbi:MAG: nucleoside deaminase [Stellaceae bacterium]